MLCSCVGLAQLQLGSNYLKHASTGHGKSQALNVLVHLLSYLSTLKFTILANWYTESNHISVIYQLTQENNDINFKKIVNQAL